MSASFQADAASQITLGQDSLSENGLSVKGFIPNPLTLSDVSGKISRSTRLQLSDRKGPLARFSISGRLTGNFKIRAFDHRQMPLGTVESRTGNRSPMKPLFAVYDSKHNPIAQAIMLPGGEIRLFKASEKPAVRKEPIARISVLSDLDEDVSILLNQPPSASDRTFKLLLIAIGAALFQEKIQLSNRPHNDLQLLAASAGGLVLGSALGAGIYRYFRPEPPDRFEKMSVSDEMKSYSSSESKSFTSFSGATDKVVQTDADGTERLKIPVDVIGQQNGKTALVRVKMHNVCGINSAFHALREFLRDVNFQTYSNLRSNDRLKLERDRKTLEKKQWSLTQLKSSATQQELPKLEADLASVKKSLTDVEKLLLSNQHSAVFAQSVLTYLSTLNKREDYIGKSPDKNFPGRQLLLERSGDVLLQYIRRKIALGIADEDDDIAKHAGVRQISSSEFILKTLGIIDPQHALGFLEGNYGELQDSQKKILGPEVLPKSILMVETPGDDKSDKPQNWVDHFVKFKSEENEDFRAKDGIRYDVHRGAALFAVGKAPKHLFLEFKSVYDRGSENISSKQPTKDATQDISIPFHILKATDDPLDALKKIAKHDPDAPQVALHKMEPLVVILHAGTINGGHYTAYIKREGNWVYCNDSKITVDNTSAGQAKAVRNMKHFANLILYRQVNNEATD